MEKKIQELTTIIRELTFEIADLKQRIRELEKEKAQEEYRPTDLKDKILLRAEGYENLGGIYKEGYHICSMAYGEPREEECLFCIAFMGRE
ncbi:MAG: DNA replication initiation control protein YabA [Syntrophomonadaceae bacterium]|jgi:regulator of replication initiation timing|nr:DNA replication initiation control protein YabA [Syntrophomonadaceae bacterium]